MASDFELAVGVLFLCGIWHGLTEADRLIDRQLDLSVREKVNLYGHVPWRLLFLLGMVILALSLASTPRGFIYSLLMPVGAYGVGRMIVGEGVRIPLLLTKAWQDRLTVKQWRNFYTAAGVLIVGGSCTTLALMNACP
ncbi:MAG: hypothetical protein WCY11_04835, partial [Novosphingobium sp.]